MCFIILYIYLWVQIWSLIEYGHLIGFNFNRLSKKTQVWKHFKSWRKITLQGLHLKSMCICPYNKITWHHLVPTNTIGQLRLAATWEWITEGGCRSTPRRKVWVLGWRIERCCSGPDIACTWLKSVGSIDLLFYEHQLRKQFQGVNTQRQDISGNY